MGWTPAHGIMQAVSPAFSGSTLVLAARDASGSLWWNDTASGAWMYVGYAGLAKGQLSAGPH